MMARVNSGPKFDLAIAHATFSGSATCSTNLPLSHHNTWRISLEQPEICFLYSEAGTMQCATFHKFTWREAC